MSSVNSNDDFGIGAYSEMFDSSQKPIPSDSGSPVALLPAVPIVANTNGAEKKTGKRKAQLALSPPQTRSKSQKKGDERSIADPTTATTHSASKKAKTEKKGKAVTETGKIAVKGTLGDGDNAAYTHPSTPTPKTVTKTGVQVAAAGNAEVPAGQDTTRLFNELSTAEQWVYFQQFMRGKPVAVPASTDTGLPSPEATPIGSKTSGGRANKTIILDSDEESELTSEDEATAKTQLGVSEQSLPVIDPFSDDSDSEEEGGPLRQCQVTRPDSGDPLLVDTIEGLPALQACGLVGVAKSTRLYVFSEWLKLDGFLLKAAKSCITFARHNEYVNLARCDPADLNVYSSGQKKPKHYLQVGDDSAICLTPVCVGLSLLGENRNDLDQHELGGILHSHEFDRFIATLGMAFNVQSLKPNLWKNLFKFVTYSNKYGGGTFNVDSTASSSLIATSSPGKFSPKKGKIVQPLGGDVKVPVFDARGLAKFRLNKVVEKLASMDDSKSITEKMKEIGLREYPENLKGGSFVVVAHTVNAAEQMWENERVLGVNCNIQWAILLVEGTHKAPL